MRQQHVRLVEAWMPGQHRQKSLGMSLGKRLFDRLSSRRSRPPLRILFETLDGRSQ
jgi:hypothetical protein